MLKLALFKDNQTKIAQFYSFVAAFVAEVHNSPNSTTRPQSPYPIMRKNQNPEIRLNMGINLFHR